MELQTTLGAIEIGILIGILLTGVQLLQLYHYFRNFPDDPRRLKIMVLAVSILDTVHTLLLVQFLYHFTIIDFGYIDLSAFPFSYWISFIIENLVVLLAEMFFTCRIYMMTRNIFITAICAVLDAIRFAFAVIGVQRVYAIHTMLGISTWGGWQYVAYASLATASDVFNTVVLCTILVRNRSGIQRTDRLVDKLVAYTISSGLLTSMVTLTTMICYLTMDNMIWLGTLSTVSKFLVNAILASLNARTSMRYPDIYTVNIEQISFHRPARVEMETALSVTDHQNNSIHPEDESKANV